MTKADDAYQEGRLDQAIATPRLADMLLAIDDAARIESDSQYALLAAGIRAEPYGPAMRRIVCLEAALGLLARIQENVRQWPKGVQEVIRGEALPPPSK